MKKIFTILSIFFIVESVFAQNVAEFSLEQAKKYALEHNYNNQKSKLDIKIAKKKVTEIRAIGLPQVNAEAKVQKFLDVATSLAPANAFNPAAPAGELAELQFGLDYNNSVGITASQLIFDGSYIVGLQAAKTYREVSVNNQIKTEVELKEAIVQAYFTVLVANENAEVLNQSLTSTEKMLTETKALYEVGLIEEQSVDQLMLTTNELKTSVGIANGQIEFAEKLLKLQMGIDIDSVIFLSDNIDAFVSNISLEPLQKEFNVVNHIDFQLIEGNVRLMKLNLRKEKYSFLPSLNVFFNHQQQNMSNEFDMFSGGDWYPMTVVGASLKLPILTSGSRLAKMSQAKIEFDKAEIDAEQVEQNLKYQSQLSKSNYETEYETYSNQKSNLELAKKIYDKTIKKYKEGVASSLELSQTQNQYLNAEGKYIKSLFDLLKAKSALEKSYGK
ncbi:MAG: TolC family protein [Flavobacteriales bacterium]|nr:TolC family protein [Flavobacteriales bacterium]